MAEKGIRVIRAEYAIKAAEARLAAQAVGLATVETRATALIGWASVAAAGALAVTFGGNHDLALRWAAGVGFCMAACAGLAASPCLRTADWVMPGREPGGVMIGPETETEAAFYESLARGYGSGVGANSARLQRAGACLDRALLIAACAIPSAVAGGLLGPRFGRAFWGI